VTLILLLASSVIFCPLSLVVITY